ncbi:hypothetical protein D5R93_01540 [Actinomyces lilanjuaniae]|uniref:Uncharacterized protein n=1 Tax=Actinomyces lilanjuaniae TaxID=2321394 RepID=A0ABM6Z1G5_9ACTO|nr:hypothetical protein [Actinomyces lilanjuaniae]AYD89064.1 hypothetical protein D5R93_01540 [Actinomyces lilanjuaniae]
MSPSADPDDEREQRLRNRNQGSPEGGGTVVPGTTRTAPTTVPGRSWQDLPGRAGRCQVLAGTW